MLHIVNSYIKSIFKYQKKYIKFPPLVVQLTGVLFLSSCQARLPVDLNQKVEVNT